MKAIILSDYGDTDVLRFGEVATPEPPPGEVLVKVHNVSVNVTLDIILRKGNYPMKPRLPHVMGIDPVGEISAVGDGVSPQNGRSSDASIWPFFLFQKLLQLRDVFFPMC